MQIPHIHLTWRKIIVQFPSMSTLPSLGDAPCYKAIPTPKRAIGRPSNDSRKWGVLDYKQKFKRGRPSGKRKQASKGKRARKQVNSNICVHVHAYTRTYMRACMHTCIQAWFFECMPGMCVYAGGRKY